MSRWSRHSRGRAPTKRSANELARGARTGVFTIRMPLEVNTVSKAVVNFASRSRIKNLNWPARSSVSISRLRACWGHPLAVRVGRHAKDTHPPGADFHHEEHVDPVAHHGVDVPEVTGEHPRAPGRARTPAKRNHRRTTKRESIATPAVGDSQVAVGSTSGTLEDGRTLIARRSVDLVATGPGRQLAPSGPAQDGGRRGQAQCVLQSVA